MQAIELQKPTDKKLTLTGAKGIYPYLTNRAQERIKNKTHIPEKEPDDEIAILIRDYERVTEWIHNKPQEEQEKLLIIPKQIKSEALKIMVNYRAGSEKQMSALRITGSDILFERALQTELAEYIILSMLEYDFLIDELRKLAEGGRAVVNTKIRDLKDNYRAIRDTEKKLIASYFPSRSKAKAKPEKEYDFRGNEIESEAEPIHLNRGEMLPDEYRPEDKPLTLKDCSALIRKIRKQIREEKRAQAKEFSEPQNLCFSLFNSERVEILKEGIRFTLIEPYERIEQLGKSSLKNLLAIIIRLINDHYDTQIKEKCKEVKNMNRQPNKKLSASDKRELIQLGKAEGIKQADIAKQLSCSIRTVKLYWK